MRTLLAAALLAASPALAQAPAAALAPAPQGRILTLDESLRLARAAQPQLRQARATSEAASARADEARASLLPQLDGTASYQRSTNNFVSRPAQGQPTAAASAATLNFWFLGATLSQILWDGGALGRWRAARSTAEAQRATEQETAVQVTAGVRTAYFAARAAKDLVTVARDTVANQEKHLQQIQGFVEVGTRPQIDLAQARTDLANAQVQLINAENGYATGKAQLNQAIGIDGPADYDVADESLPPISGEDATSDALLDEALRGRPDVAAQERTIRAQELSILANKAGYLPSLGVSSAVSEAGPSLDQTVWNWNAQLVLTWNLFGGGLTRAQVEEAKANLEVAQAQEAALRQQVRLDVEQARLAVRAAKAALSAAGDALENARERLRLAEGRYQTGAGSIIELGDAQVALTSAAAQRVQADYNLASARAQLLRALGRGATGAG